jgi:uncharacterized protein (DUF488 family)
MHTQKCTSTIYTLGYQGLSLKAYVQALVNAAVGLVIDVREHAWSQRPEFVKSALAASLKRAGIEYQHWKILGNPTMNRRTARTAAQCLSRYRVYLREQSGAIDVLITKVRTAERSLCLTCYENDSVRCHRSVIAEELIRIDPDMCVIDLAPARNSGTNGINQASTTKLLRSAYLRPTLLPFIS